MSVLDTLIFDRTGADLENDTDKAYISYADLNRVEESCGHLGGILGVSIQTKVWNMEDFRTESEMARLLNNIRILRAAFFTKTSTPSNPEKITYMSIYQANDIEQILYDIGSVYDSMVSGRRKLSFSLGRKQLGNRR